MALWLLLATLPLMAGQPDRRPCQDLEAAVTAAVAARRQAGERAAANVLAGTGPGSPACFGSELARLATAAWLHARAAAAAGGAPEALAPARALVVQLAALPAGSRDERRHAEYAQAAVTAAMAASQDERGEMRLFLTHARSIDERLTLTGPAPVWPLPIDELEGALWLEVDRYRDARAAYERAVQRDTSAHPLIGLARTQARMGEAALACESYRRALTTAAGELADEARAYLASFGC